MILYSLNWKIKYIRQQKKQVIICFLLNITLKLQ